jgi:ketosteroid isomerase-like protein
VDPLALVKRSPEVVAKHDKQAWLGLFTNDATLQDPVGGATYTRQQFSSFWDVFIAPNQVEFLPKRDFVKGDLVVRHVTISVKNEAAGEALQVPAIIEYRVAGDQIASLRAFWEGLVSVKWFASHGLAGIKTLLEQSGRMATKLGLGPSLQLGRAMKPAIPREKGTALIERLAEMIREDQLPNLPRDGRRLGMHPEELVLTGDHVATILSSADRVLAAVAIAKVENDRLTNLCLLWS